MEKIINSNIRRLHFKYLSGTINIITHDESYIKIISDSEEIEFNESGSNLEISGKTTEVKFKSNKNPFFGFFGRSNVNIGNSVVIGNNNVVSSDNIVMVNGKVINGNVFSASEIIKVEMTVYVPQDVIKSINCSASNTEFTIEKISSKLEIDKNGSGSLNISDIKHIILDLSGQTGVTIINSFNIDLDISGQNDINIISILDKLKIDASGMNHINVDGNIEFLDCDMSGMCDLTIHGNVKHKSMDTSGMCSVHIK